MNKFGINLGGLAERALWTFVQAFGGYFTAIQIFPATLGDWKVALVAAAGAGILSVLKTLGVAATVTNTTPAVAVAQTKVIETPAEPVLPTDHPVDISVAPTDGVDGGYQPKLDESGDPAGKHVA